MNDSLGKIINFQDDFKLSSKLQGKFHWSHIRLVQKEADPTNRVAVVASKKAIDKRAVLRNRVKRRLRPLMRKISAEWVAQSDFHSSCSLRWILRPKNSALSSDYLELENDVRQTFERLLRGLTASPQAVEPRTH